MTGEERWVVEIPNYWNGGVLGTEGGLVFQGNALGFLNAYDKETGETLWSFNTYTSMLAPPITFELDGEQYVSILTGTGGGDLFGEASSTGRRTCFVNVQQLRPAVGFQIGR